MRHLLQQVHPKTSYTDWSIAYTRQGAPQLLRLGEPSGYHISFSHSQKHCVVALSRLGPLAVDIECFGSGRDFEALGEYLCGHHQWQLAEFDETPFLARWTLWEVCAKLAGQSALSVRNEIFERLQNQASLNRMVSDSNWQVLQISAKEQTVLTVLMDHPENAISEFRKMSLQDIQPWNPAAVIRSAWGASH